MINQTWIAKLFLRSLHVPTIVKIWRFATHECTKIAGNPTHCQLHIIPIWTFVQSTPRGGSRIFFGGGVGGHHIDFELTKKKSLSVRGHNHLKTHKNSKYNRVKTLGGGGGGGCMPPWLPLDPPSRPKAPLIVTVHRLLSVKRKIIYQNICHIFS